MLMVSHFLQQNLLSDRISRYDGNAQMGGKNYTMVNNTISVILLSDSYLFQTAFKFCPIAQDKVK